MLNDKTVELKEELKFRDLHQEFSDNELTDYERNGVSFEAIRNSDIGTNSDT